MGQVSPSERAAALIGDDLLASGLRRGGIVLVHSSLSSMGRVPGGPETVVRGILTALGPEGTLLMPALTYERVTREHPFFDVLRTPSNVGAIPEHFRLRDGTRRSLHPTHSVCAVGPHTAALLDEHHLDRTPVGAHSPFRKVQDFGGQLLFLGCGLRPNTSMHGVEELVEPPYLFGEMITYRIMDAHGHEGQIAYRRHAFNGWRQHYDRVEALLEEGTEIVRGRVLQATTHIIESRALWARAREALEGDPFYFVERAPSRASQGD